MIRRRAPGAPTGEGVRLSILHVPDCPGLARLRAGVESALARVGVTAVIDEIVGEYHSPTLLVDGVGIDGHPVGEGAACRTHLPTEDQIASALLAATDTAQAKGGSR
jgi:hypothetical protein